jgi:hypothetical protein
MEELMQVPNGNQRITALSSPLSRTLQPRFVIRTVDSNAGGLGYFGANDPASGSTIEIKIFDKILTCNINKLTIVLIMQILLNLTEVFIYYGIENISFKNPLI